MSKKEKRRTTNRKTQKKSRRTRTPLIPQGVGILSSMPFVNPLRADFISGLGPATLLKNEQANLGYDPAALAVGLGQLIQDTSVGLIVTVGGSVTWAAASKNPGGSSKPYISLIGGLAGGTGTVPGLGKFVGAISLESFARNPNRIDKLKRDIGGMVDSNEICLLSNPNSHMAPTETDATAWPGRVVRANVTPNSANPRRIYDQAFAEIAALTNPAVRGVVVSADPTFKQTADDLVGAANNWVSTPGRRICYPLQEYAATNPPPAGGSRVLHGPKLRQAYKKIGAMAKKYLKNPKPDIIDEEPEIVN